MSSTKSSGGSRWFMALSLVAMLVALVMVGMQLRKPAATHPASAGTSTPEAGAGGGSDGGGGGSGVARNM